ncbi:MAG TPA: type II toxin-antitoxin system VapC family toxin [Methylomirabilota bacterium]|nr:type II toxin-antitoxin system VapC family toxin [Methylomirabilota bacterium]
MYLIDTDILIWVLRGNKKYEDFLQELKDKGTMSISTVTIAEIYKNIFPSEIVKTENALNEFQAWDVSTSIGKQPGLYWQEYPKKLKNLNLKDCLIAATANVHSAKLVTLNSKYFPMKDISVLIPLTK